MSITTCYATDGDLKWTYDDAVNPIGTAIDENGNIYISDFGTGGGEGYSNDDGGLIKLDSDGNLLWKYIIGYQISSSPVIDDSLDTIYLPSANGLYAINSDGTLKWQYDVGRSLAQAIVDSNGVIYIGSENSKLYAINSDGTLKYEASMTGVVRYSAPLIDLNGIAYIGDGNQRTRAINTDGSIKWTHISTNVVNSNPVMNSNGLIIIGSANKDLYALNPSDGTESWSYTAPQTIYGGIAIDGSDVTYFGTIDNKLYAIDSDGNLDWTYTTGGWIYNSIPNIAADGTIFVGSWDNKLHAINSDGTLKWSYTTGGDIDYLTSIAQDGTIYVVSDDDKVYAIEGSSGPLYTPQDYFDGNIELHYAMSRNQISNETPVTHVPYDPPTPPVPPLPEPELTIIEEILQFLLTPFNWLLLLFAYLGAFFARILDPEQDGVEETELLVTNVLFFGTIGWIVILLINFIGFTILSTGIDFFNVLIFFAGGFLCALIPALRTEKSTKKPTRTKKTH